MVVEVIEAVHLCVGTGCCMLQCVLPDQLHYTTIPSLGVVPLTTKSGFLKKDGHSFIPSRNKRYFVLERGTLTYYKKRFGDKLKVLDLANYVLDGNDQLRFEQKSIRLKHIRDPKLDYVLYSESTEDLISWKKVGASMVEYGVLGRVRSSLLMTKYALSLLYNT